MSPRSVHVNPVTSFLVYVLVAAGLALGYWQNLYFGIALLVAALIVATSLKMANAWQKFVILRMGKLQAVRGAGLFAIIPVLDNVVAITNYREAIDRVSQTSLREMIGSSVLASLLSDRKDADVQLKLEIGQKTAPWGISVSAVEIRDVAIPVALQDAMSRQAQAAREKQARVILGSAEAEIAGKFVEAAAVYAGHPWALQLRAMNIIYETTKERGATILMSSSMVGSLDPSPGTLALALAASSVAAEGRNAPAAEVVRAPAAA